MSMHQCPYGHHSASERGGEVHNIMPLYSAATESGPSSLSSAVSGTLEVGVSGGSWERSSEHRLTVGEMTSGLVSQDSVLCSEVAVVVVVVATLGGTGSNSSSSSSKMGDSWTSLRTENVFLG